MKILRVCMLLRLGLPAALALASAGVPEGDYDRIKDQIIAKQKQARAPCPTLS